jgi:putative ABC transport system permease protein
LVKAKDAGSVTKVTQEISKALPGAQVVTTSELADQVTGSLADTKKLADRFGAALGLIVLTGAFVIAILLTLSAVAKRVREIGTLRAIGWSKSMVVRQILFETLGIGIVGGVLGAALGVGAGYVVSQFSPALSASSTGVPNAASSSLARLFGITGQTVSKTVHLTVPVEASTLALGIAFALIGGILAGIIGGWRAARLQPAVALRDIG